MPTNLCEHFDAEALAFWFMDDGGRNSAKGSGLVLDVSGFSVQSQHLLKDILDSNFGLETTFHRRSLKNTKIYIRASSASKFCDLVRPWISHEMMHKLTR